MAAGAGYVAAGAAGGAAGETTTELLRGEKINGGKVALAAGIGAVTNIPGGAAIKGINAGRGSMAAVAKGMTTKLMNGSAKSMSAKTVGKIFVATLANGTNAIAATGTATAVKNKVCDHTKLCQ